MRDFKHLVNGKSVIGKGTTIKVYNPDTGETLNDLVGIDEYQATEALEAANKAFKTWSKLSINEREGYILNFRKEIEINKNNILDILMKETGKPLSNALYDYNMLLDCLSYFIEEAKRLNGSVIPDYDNAHINMITRKPVGVVLGHLAWNFPLLNLGYKLGPTLASGCTCVLKPSKETPLASLFIGELAVKSGMPEGVVNIIVGSGGKIHQALNESTIPQLITLIGSTNTGKAIVKQSTTSVKNYSLELGGNAPFIIFEDADIDAAVEGLCGLKYGNAGQICVSANRVFVHKNIKDEVIKKVEAYIDNIVLKVGDDLKSDKVFMGPVSSKGSQERMEFLVKDAVEKGAKLLKGGKKERGFYFEPTLLVDVSKDSEIYKDEIFGPLMGILEFDDESDIVELANDTEYGLSAYVYTNNLKRAMKLSQEIEAGSVLINEPHYHYTLPHGGCKESGIGKDCSVYSLEEYYYIKRVSIKM